MYVYYRQTPALAGVCLDVKKGDYLGIIGPNGGGKSTLLRVILGLVPASSGKVTVFGQNPKNHGVKIGYVPQFSSTDKNFPISVFEAVISGRLPPGITPFFRYSAHDRERAESLIDRVGLSKLKKRRISDLSGGEFQKMLIARALASDPALLVLDEPTASVDASSREQIYTLLGELNQSMTIILVTHDLLAISSQVSVLACLNSRLIYHGEPSVNDGVVKSLYGCPVDLLAHGVPHRVLREHDDEENE